MELRSFFFVVSNPQDINKATLSGCQLCDSHVRRLTQSDLTKGDRTRVMVCITMDAHGRDVVQKMAREGVTMVRNVQTFFEEYFRLLTFYLCF